MVYAKESLLLVRVEELDGWKRKLLVELSEDDVKTKSGELLKKVAADVEMDGFRKGKAPKAVIEQRYGAEAMREALGSLLSEAYVAAVKEAGIHPVCDPDVQLLEDQPTDGKYTFAATVAVKPEFEVGDLSALEFTEQVPIVSDDDVGRAVEELREAKAELVAPGRPSASGDFVVIDYDKLDDDGKPEPETGQKDFPCELGTGRLPAELEEALVGVSVGEQKDVTINYPDDYGHAELAGKSISFGVTIKDVRAKRLPVVDDEFARSLGPFETLLDLRVKVRGQLEEQAKGMARERLYSDIVGRVVEQTEFELPECMTDDRLDRMFERMKKEAGDGAPEPDRAEFDKTYREMTGQRIRAELILSTFASENGVEVTEDDVKKRIAELAEQQGRDPAAAYDELKGTEMFDEMYRELEDRLWLEKVHEQLVDKVKVTTESIELPASDQEQPDAAETTSGD